MTNQHMLSQNSQRSLRSFKHQYVLHATLLLSVATGCETKPAPSSADSSNDSTQKSHLSFADVESPWSPEPPIYDNGETAGILSILESLGGGVGVLDFDLDGHFDLLFPGGGTLARDSVTGLPNQLQRSLGQRYVDVSNASLIAPSTHYTHGCAVGDFNNDGFADVLITGYGGVSLWENLGDGTFENVTLTAAVDDASWSSSAGWGDLDGDGNLDLYLAHYVDWSLQNNPPCEGPGGKQDVCPPRQFKDLKDSVYLSNGDGTFRNATESIGLAPGGKGLGVLMTDVDNDFDLDAYVANDTTNNFLYLNQGNGTFVEEGVISGTAIDHRANANGSMGLAVFDYNNDAVSDLWVTNYEDEVSALYEGSPGAIFQHVSTRVGIQTLGQLFVGFGCVAVDLDLDGDEDIAIANGHVVHFPRNAPTLQKPLLLENQSGIKFDQFHPDPNSYLDTPARGRGLVRIDYNADGLPDLLFVNSRQAPAIVENRSTGNGRAVYFQLYGRESNRSAIGSRIRLLDQQGEKQMTRWIYGGGSYLSSNSPDVHFGVPADFQIGTVEITWPNGVQTVLNPDQLADKLSGTQRFVIIEPSESKSLPQPFSL